MGTRDQSLDIYRGLIMIYIVGVIHVIFWLQPFAITVEYFLLFEMAVIFFVTGASHTMSRPKSLLSLYITRFSRILIPYLIFSVICLLMLFVNGALKNELPAGYSKTALILEWLNPFGKRPANIAYINWHGWFVPVYLVVTLLIPHAYKLFEKMKGLLKAVPLLLLAGLVYWTDLHGPWVGKIAYIKYASYYLFWVYLGFFYPILKQASAAKWVLLSFSGVSLYAVYWLSAAGQYPLDMQLNKFPPNFMFLMFCLGAFGVASLGKPLYLALYKVRLFKRIIDQYSNYSLTIYLYHPLAFLLIGFLFREVEALRVLTDNPYVLTLSYSILAVAFVYVLPYLFGRFERIKIPGSFAGRKK
ncbi:acyltransferase family protein [Paenibacillus turpanensis]|uniref:acyltransferase family protein n=1 Tax=Paenibacillus turpanensis TaxID=2689078 RepID=UPI001407D5EB|nr:acyltransferase [Paenibacillus turpanensis]